MSDFVFDLPKGPADDVVQRWLDRIHRLEVERLESEAKLFIAMGFAPQELLIVQDVNGGNTQVIPHLSD